MLLDKSCLTSVKIGRNFCLWIYHYITIVDTGIKRDSVLKSANYSCYM